jgi:hypothetical protein
MPGDGVQLMEPRRDKPSLRGAVALSFALLLIFLSFFRVYYIGGYGDCDMLWNDKEAYVFIHGERRGYNVSYLGYVGELAKEYLEVIDSPDDRISFTSIVRITPSGIERYWETKIFDHYTPFVDGLYANNDGQLWKWADTHFVQESTVQQWKLHGVERLSRKDFNDVNGWSGLYSAPSKMKEQFSIQVGGLPVAVEVKDGQVSINLSRPGNPPEIQRATEKLYYGQGHTQRVSKVEYEHVFGS